MLIINWCLIKFLLFFKNVLIFFVFLFLFCECLIVFVIVLVDSILLLIFINCLGVCEKNIEFCDFNKNI